MESINRSKFTDRGKSTGSELFERGRLQGLHEAMDLEFLYSDLAAAANRRRSKIKKVLRIGKVTPDKIRRNEKKDNNKVT